MHAYRHILLAFSLTLLLAACSSNSSVSAPTGLTVTPGAGKITLNWQDTSSGEASFSVYRQQVSSGDALTSQQTGFEKHANVPAGTPTYDDTRVSPETLYRY